MIIEESGLKVVLAVAMTCFLPCLIFGGGALLRLKTSYEEETLVRERSGHILITREEYAEKVADARILAWVFVPLLVIDVIAAVGSALGIVLLAMGL